MDGTIQRLRTGTDEVQVEGDKVQQAIDHHAQLLKRAVGQGQISTLFLEQAGPIAFEHKVDIAAGAGKRSPKKVR
jgi:hypothetical protein